jgi:hypothetical protein
VHFKDIIIELPPGLEYECPTTGRKLQYARLNKALYGLIQAPHRWNKTFHAYLIDIGFTQHPQDPCLYYIIQGKDFMILGNYVDDLIKVTNCTKLREQIDKLLEARFKITHQGVLTEFIGLQCGWRESGGERYFEVHQGKYLDKILTRFGMSNCNSVSTPALAHGKPHEVYMYPNPNPAAECDPEVLSEYVQESSRCCVVCITAY